MEEGVQQLALTTSVLGGFSFTFLSAILTIKSTSKIKFWLIILLMVASMCFLLSSLGWSMMDMGGDKSELNDYHQFLVKLLLFGLISLISSISISGWMNDKKTGIATGIIGIISIIVLFTVILSRYITV